VITKELLSEVLGDDYKERLVDWYQIEDDNYLRSYYNCGNFDKQGRPTGLGLEINIYELTHKCKEWACTKNYFLFSGYGAISASCEVNHRTASLGKINPQEIVLADTEPEACFLACEWILENKDN
jgi:hypothetical protein